VDASFSASHDDELLEFKADLPEDMRSIGGLERYPELLGESAIERRRVPRGTRGHRLRKGVVFKARFQDPTLEIRLALGKLAGSSIGWMILS